MMSSFRPIGLSISRPPGTKAWINGQTLISTGNKDLDGVLGGGICLGTITLLEEDRFSDHAMALARYFIAQGVSSGQRTLIVGAEGVEELNEMVSSLPFDLNHCKYTLSSSSASSSSSSSIALSTPAIPEEPFAPPSSSSALPTVPEDSLTIAWQYRKYMGAGAVSGQQQPQGKGPTTYCNSYDLSRTMQEEVFLQESNDSNRPQILDVATNLPFVEQGGDWKRKQYAMLHDALTRAIAEIPPRTVLRIVIKSFMDKTADWSSDWRQALHFLHSLRGLVRSLSPSVAVLITTPAHQLPRHARCLFTRVADTVLEVDSFSSKRRSTPAEFADFAGLLYIKALQHVNAMTPLRGPSNKFGIKRDRRKLHIEPLHLPPEDVRTLTEDVEKGKKKASISSVSRMLCGAPSKTGAGGSLDF